MAYTGGYWLDTPTCLGASGHPHMFGCSHTSGHHPDAPNSPYVQQPLIYPQCFPIYLNTPICSNTPNFLEWHVSSTFGGIKLIPPYVWGHLDTLICLDAPIHLDTPWCLQHPHMFKHPFVCPQCFPVHLPYVISRPPHLHKVEAVQNQFFQDYHTLPK